MSEEYEQYKMDQAEAWLVRIRRLAKQRDRFEQLASEETAKADMLKGMDYSRPAVSVSPTSDAIPNAVIAHEELRDTFLQLANESRDMVTEAVRALARMDDPTEMLCLQLYYVKVRKDWFDVSSELGYAYDGIMKLRRRALLHAYDVMPHSEREPMPPAL